MSATSRACATCGFASVHKDERVIGECVPDYHTLALVEPRHVAPLSFEAERREYIAMTFGNVKAPGRHAASSEVAS